MSGHRTHGLISDGSHGGQGSGWGRSQPAHDSGIQAGLGHAVLGLLRQAKGLGGRQRPQDTLVETRRGKCEHARLIPGESGQHPLEQGPIRGLPLGESIRDPASGQGSEREIGVPFLMQLQDVRGSGWDCG